MLKESCAAFVRAERARKGVGVRGFCQHNLRGPSQSSVGAVDGFYGPTVSSCGLRLARSARAHGCWIDGVYVGGAGSEADSRRSHLDVFDLRTGFARRARP